jgi:hypothetical protein
MHASDESIRYRNLNRFLLYAMLACLAWPFAVWALMHIFPQALQTCSSIRFFNRPCPMCGLTRGFLELVQGNLSAALAFNPLTPLLSLLLFVEIALRAALSTDALASAAPGPLPRLDAKIHMMLGLAYLVYGLVFIIRTW